jgi:hypothetical protein
MVVLEEWYIFYFWSVGLTPRPPENLEYTHCVWGSWEGGKWYMYFHRHTYLFVCMCVCVNETMNECIVCTDSVGRQTIWYWCVQILCRCACTTPPLSSWNSFVGTTRYVDQPRRIRVCRARVGLWLEQRVPRPKKFRPGFTVVTVEPNLHSVQQCILNLSESWS